MFVSYIIYEEFSAVWVVRMYYLLKLRAPLAAYLAPGRYQIVLRAVPDPNHLWGDRSE
jgi:hypothetical protein